MALLDIHPWARFFAGMLAGCWIGAAVACAGILLLAGRRIRHLEQLNLLLRARLIAHGKLRRSGSVKAGPALVMPLPESQRRTARPPGRVINIH